MKVSKRFLEKDQVCVCGWKTNREGTDVEGNEKGYETEHVCEVGRGREKEQMSKGTRKVMRRNRCILCRWLEEVE